jgi:RimJ/RimL family protein N-acetyltransferase
MSLTLRAWTSADVPLLPGGDSEYDDWGPRSPYATLPSAKLDEQGGLVIEVDGVVVGLVSWIWLHWGPNAGSRNPMIGIWLRREARGLGHGSAAQRALVDLIFRHTPANRVEAHTDVTNEGEKRALERAGFTAEGVVRGAQWRNGSWHDGVLYSVLRSEWAPA